MLPKVNKVHVNLLAAVSIALLEGHCTPSHVVFTCLPQLVVLAALPDGISLIRFAVGSCSHNNERELGNILIGMTVGISPHSQLCEICLDIMRAGCQLPFDFHDRQTRLAFPTQAAGADLQRI
jgi:hypothetical protein